MSRFIWRNGIILPESEALVSLYDSAMMYADHVFTMLRTFDGEPFAWEAHAARMRNSAALLGLPRRPLARLRDAYDALSAANRAAAAFAAGDEIRTVITYSAGALPMYRHLNHEPWLMICQYPLRWVLAAKAHLYRDGASARLTRVRGIPEATIPTAIKHHNRLHFRLAERQAERAEPGAWALVRGADSAPAEGTGANVFAVVGKRLFTPPESVCLPGITRANVLDLARKLGVDVSYGWPLRFPNEMFFTCTPFSIVPCTRYDGAPVGDGRPGPVTRRLIEAWKEMVGLDFVAQAEGWDGNGA